MDGSGDPPMPRVAPGSPRKDLIKPTANTSMMENCSGDWQLNKKKITERSQYAFENSKLSDCSFRVGKEPHTELFSAHKVILGWTSPVFQAMFYGGFAEKDGPIEVPDVTPEAFKAMLEYIYTDNINLSSFDLGCDLLYTAKKYILPFVEEKCKMYLIDNLNHENTCRMYEFAKLLQETEIADRCLKIMREKTDKIIKDPSFEEVEQSTLVKILEQKHLMIDSELELIEASLRWARREAESRGLSAVNGGHLREILGPAFPLLRFLTLSPSQFASGPALSDLLTREESFAILINLNSSGSMEIPSSICTSTEPRICPRCEVDGFTWSTLQSSHICQCLDTINNTQILEAFVVFSTSQNIRLIGIQLPSQIPNSGKTSSKPESYTEMVIVSVVGPSKNLLGYVHFEKLVQFDSVVEVKFDSPVYLKAGDKHTLRVWMHRPGMYPRCSFNATEAKAGEINFSFHGFSSDDVVRGILFTPSFAPLQTFNFSSTAVPTTSPAPARKYAFSNPLKSASPRS